MPYRFEKGIVAVLAAALLCACGQNAEIADAPAAEIRQEHRFGFDPDTLSVTSGTVKKNEFFSNLLTRLGMSLGEAYALSEACDTLFDVRKLRAGNAWNAYYSEDTSAVADKPGTKKRLEYIVYSQDKVTDVIFRCTEPYGVWVSDKPVTVERKFADVTISSSLWNDMLEEGVSPLLILEPVGYLCLDRRLFRSAEGGQVQGHL